jgi:two-component system, chemotaxis family, protein-glutamate methylesterase/glutaminase
MQQVSARDLVAFHLVAMAASAGGLAAIAGILAHLPPNFPLPIAVVQHVAPDQQNLIVEILSGRTGLKVRRARDGDALEPGVVYVAPPGRHLEIVAAGMIVLTSEPLVHFLRPSADRLFESAARSLGPIIGVILSGTGTDGSEGARAIRAAGGLVIAQDEASSAFFGMPHAAIDAGVVDRVLALNEIAPALRALTETS